MEKDSNALQKIGIFISENNLSVEDEYSLWKLLGERIRGQNKCLATVVAEVLTEKKKEEIEKHIDFCLHVLDKCFWKTETGCMEAAKLSDRAIQKYIIMVREEFGLNRLEEQIFILFLNLGLNKLSDDGALKFTPDRMIFRKYIASQVSISYIQNPYSEEETEKIITWVKEHPADVRAMAIELWFTKGLTMSDIILLTKKDCWGDSRHSCIRREGVELFCRSTVRSQIVRRALDTHPKDVQYIFSVPSSDYSGWEKLTKRGILMKLQEICKKTGISYKPILVNEAISLK